MLTLHTWTCRHSSSAVEYTATVFRPSSLQARITRTAISPRLAIKTLENLVVAACPSAARVTNRAPGCLLHESAALKARCTTSPASQPHRLLLCTAFADCLA